MTMELIKPAMGEGGAHTTGVGMTRIVTELQGLRVKTVAGAAASTKMNVADLRIGDTLVSVLALASGAFTDDTANCTIQDTHATGTVTCAGVTANDTITTDGNTYTFVSSAQNVNAGGPYVVLGANDNATAANLAAAINAYETRPVSKMIGVQTKAAVTASVVNNVVTIRAVVDAAAGNGITLTSSNGTRLAVSGAGTLTGGTATGGIKSTTNNSAANMLVVYFNKDNA